MKRYLLSLAFILWSVVAHAACIPPAATPGMIGCLPLATGLTTSDYVEVWQPGQFPNAARIVQISGFPGGGGGSPGGVAGNVQYNNSGVFGGYTNTQLTALVQVFTSTLSGSVPASGGGITAFLRADGNWAVPPGGVAGPVPPVVSGNLAQWNGTSGALLGSGVPVGTTGVSTVVQTLGSGLISNSVIPFPTVSLPGGVVALASTTSFWVNGLTTAGVLTTAQPAFSNISGQIASTQLPTLAANQVLGALTATTPSGLSVPSCSGTSNALQYTSGTGFGCATVTGSGGGSANVKDFIGGTDYTAGTTTSLTLPSTPINAASLTIYFDGVRQSANTWSLATATITFNAAIPLSTQVVEAWWGTVAGSTPAAGSSSQVQFNSSNNFAASSGFTFDSTSKISLGTTGTSTGAIGFNNTGSGSVTLTVPSTGALGSAVITLPDVTDTVDTIAAAQTLTNKTMSGASNTFSNIALSSLAAQNANTIVANATGSTGSPTAAPVPSCSTSQSALTWISGSGFGCNTVTAGAGGATTQVQFNTSGALNGAPGMTFDGVSVLTMGQSGTSAGAIKFANTSTGFVELIAATGTLGSSILTLPAATGTVLCDSCTQTVTNKSINGTEINSGLVAASVGGTGVNNGNNTITISGGTFVATLAGATNVTFPQSGTLLTTVGNGSSLTGLLYSQLPALAANQVLGALSATTPSGLSIPSCSSASSALIWSTGVGFGCNALASGQWANVVAFGADPTGAASSSTAISNAYASAKNIFFPCGTYLVTTAITPPSNSQALGAAYGCVLLNQTGLNGSVVGIFDVSTSTNNVTINNIICGNFASGSCIWEHGGQMLFADWDGCNGTLGACVLIDSNVAAGSLCTAGGCDVQFFISHLQVNPATGNTPSTAHTTEGIDVGAHGSQPPAGVYIVQPNVMNATDCGIRVVQASGIMVTGPGEIFNNAKGLCTFPGSGQVVFSLYISDVFSDFTTSGPAYNFGTNGGTVQNIHITNLWANGGPNAIYINQGTGRILDVSVDGGWAGGTQDAVCIMGGTDIHLANVKVNGSTQTSNTWNGITVNGAGAVHLTVTGGHFGAEAVGTPTNFAGIWIGNAAPPAGSNCGQGSSGAPDYVIIQGVDTTGNVSSGIDQNSSPVHQAIGNNL